MPWPIRPRPVAVVAVAAVIVLAVGATVFVRRGPPASTCESRLPAGGTAGRCASVRATAWNPLPGVEYTGRLRIDLPPQPRGTLVLFVGDRVALDVEARAIDGGPLGWRRHRLPSGPGPGLDVPPDFWLEAGNPRLISGEIVRLVIDAHPTEARTVLVSLGRRAPRVLARLRGYDEDAAADVCAASLDAVASAGRNGLEIDPRQASYFASGWYGVDEGGPGGVPVRWMQAYGAVLVPAAGEGPVRVRLLAAPGDDAPGGDATVLSLLVNDVFEATPQVMRRGVHAYEWLIPDASWVAGINELLLQVSRTVRPADGGGSDRRWLGLALSKVTITPVE